MLAPTPYANLAFYTLRQLNRSLLRNTLYFQKSFFQLRPLFYSARIQCLQQALVPYGIKRPIQQIQATALQQIIMTRSQASWEINVRNFMSGQNSGTSIKESVGSTHKSNFYVGRCTNSRAQKLTEPYQYYRHNPFDLVNAHSRKPLFPINAVNLRIPGISGKYRSKRGGGLQSNAKRLSRRKKLSHRFRSRVWNGGRLALYKRFPKWAAALKQWRTQRLFEWCSLRKVLAYINQGRLDTRFPITQRHLQDSGLVRIKRGVKLFNTDDLPFPFRIHIEVAAADQSSIDVINRVGGSVTIVYRNYLNLQAHLYPRKFEILPRTGRPNLNAIYALEKYRARGCIVHYIKPMWLLQEEAILKSELATMVAERDIRLGANHLLKTHSSGETLIKKKISDSCQQAEIKSHALGEDKFDQLSIEDLKEKILDNYRIRRTRKSNFRRRKTALYRRL